MMQHNSFEGFPIGYDRGERFEDRMRRIGADLLHAAALRASDDSSWFALRVMSGRERAVENVLSDAGVEVLVPVRKGPEYRRRHRVIEGKTLPVMSGYVLVRCRRSDEAFLGMCSVEHVIEVLGGCSNPHPIPNKEVLLFNQNASKGDYDWERPVSIFRKDQKVRVASGPFASFTGTIIACRADGKGDAVVEVEIFGRSTATLMPLAILQGL